MKKKTLIVKCDCGCRSKLQIFHDGDMWHIDVNDVDNKYTWHGIVITSVKKIIKFLKVSPVEGKEHSV